LDFNMAREAVTKEWNEIPFADCLQKVKLGREKQVKEKDYLKVGDYPIVDQGQSVIAGYTNDKNKVILNIQPFIIFGDHTRILKYIDFPIALGADGTKVIKPKNIFDEKFFFYFLKQLDIPSRGYNRHYTILKEKRILQPPLPEQKSIARVLAIIQEAMARQEELILKLKELKRSMMQHLFTRGTKGEKTKITEIGEVPESWDVVSLGQYLEKTKTKDPSKKPEEEFIYIDVSAVSRERFKIISMQKMLGKDAPSRARKHIQTGDIIFATVRPTLQRIAVVPEQYNNQICSTGYCVLRTDNNLDRDFLFHYLCSDTVLKHVGGLQSGASYPAIRDGVLFEMNIPFPNLIEQKNIGGALSAINNKMEIAQEKLSVYQGIFKTLLHELMGGQRRIKI